MKNAIDIRRGQTLWLLVALVMVSGCSSLDRFGTKLEVVTKRLDEPGRSIYEGQLTMVRKVGSLTVLQFADGKTFDVSEAPPALFPGDTVRIYALEEGYQALLWKSVESSMGASGAPAHGG